MADTHYGEIAYVESPKSISNYEGNHFESSQRLRLASLQQTPLSAQTPVQYLLHWVFFDEFQKISNNNTLITKLKSYGFDFSKYFYFNKPISSGRGSTIQFPIAGIALSPSGGSGNLEAYESFILSVRGLTEETIQTMERVALETTFKSNELSVLQNQFNLPNLRIELRNIDNQIQNTQ